MLMMKAKAVHVCVFFVTSVIYRHTQHTESHISKTTLANRNKKDVN